MRSPASSKWTAPCACWGSGTPSSPREHPQLTCALCTPSIFPSAEQENASTLTPTPYNTGGSLPDLTNIHFPSPLPTPLDPDEPSFPALSSSGSTGNLAANLTHLGLGGAQGRRAAPITPCSRDHHQC